MGYAFKPSARYVHSRSSKASGMAVHAACVLASMSCGPAMAQTAPALPQSDQPTTSDDASVQEISIQAERQTALDNEALTISGTQNSGPHLARVAAIIGFGPMIAPVYDGSNKMKVQPFPYVDIRGLLDDRVFISDVSGLGVKVLNDGPLRAGFSINYNSGRTSKDDPRLKGLPDIKTAAIAMGYLGYVYKPFAFEARVEHRFGASSGTRVNVGASVAAAPVPQWHLAVSANVSWADANYERTYFGITAADAAQAASQGNPLPVYTPGAGLEKVALTGSSVYQISDHWGLVARLSLQDLVGAASKDSPLVQRPFGPSIAFGAMYKF